MQLGDTPLCKAADKNAKETAALLIEEGASVNATSSVSDVGERPLPFVMLENG